MDCCIFSASAASVILVDTQGLLMAALIHSASLHDRDGGVRLMSSLFGLYPFLQKLFADGGYAGKTFRNGMKKACPHVAIAIVKRSRKAQGSEVLPKRWIVERTIAWLNRCRRLAKDRDNLSACALSFCFWHSSEPCSENFAIHEFVFGRTLKKKKTTLTLPRPAPMPAPSDVPRATGAAPFHSKTGTPPPPGSARPWPW